MRQQPTKVEYPFFKSANTKVIDIASVDLTDSVTTIVFDAYFRPNNWIRMDKDSYLRIGDKKIHGC